MHFKVWFNVVLIVSGQLHISYTQANAPTESPSTIEEAEKLYEYRISRKYLHGRYIPVDILDACRELSRLSAPKAVQKFKDADEEVVTTKLHFGLGQWISRNWGLIQGSRYSHYLKQLGTHLPDDMVRFTLTIWHRQLIIDFHGFNIP